MAFHCTVTGVDKIQKNIHGLIILPILAIQTETYCHYSQQRFISLSTFPAHLIYHRNKLCSSVWMHGSVSLAKIIPLILKFASFYLDIVVSSSKGKISSSLQRVNRFRFSMNQCTLVGNRNMERPFFILSRKIQRYWPKIIAQKV